MLMYNLEDLNKDTINWKSLKLKGISDKVSLTQSGDAVAWYQDDLKKATQAVTVVTSTTVFETAATDIIAGEVLFNRDTGATYNVASVSGAEVTITAADASLAVGDVIVRLGFSKLYGSDNSITPTRNDLTETTNYIQFSEFLIPSDMIENNKSRVFLKDGKDYMESKITDASRDAVLSAVTSFYKGVKAKTSASGTFRYTAGGLDNFIPTSYKVNIKGADDPDTKDNIRTQLEAAYGSGVDNIFGNNNLIFFCNSKMASQIDKLYEDAVQFNDEITAINMNIKIMNLEGRRLRIVESGTLNHIEGTSRAVGYLMPLQDTFMYNVPNRVMDAGNKMLPNGFGIMYQKGIDNIESVNNALATSHSFVFGTVNSGAYQRWVYA